MKLFALICAVAIGPALLAQDQARPPLTEKPRLSINNRHVNRGETFVYEQKPIPQRRTLVSPEQAQSLLDRFKTNEAFGKSTLVFYVNRDLLEVTAAVTNVPPATNAAGGDSTFRNTKWESLSLADKQTIRDLERLFGRPFRMAGATLADEKLVTTRALDGRPLESLKADTEQGRTNREALSKLADIAVEVLISSRQVTVPELSGDKTYAIPDIQATAVRLRDARILGQATASDIIGRDSAAAQVVRQFDVGEIVEATALVLMEDMLLNASR